MKLATYILFSLLITVPIFSQDLKFNNKGIAEITIKAPNTKSEVLYEDVLSFISKYYVMTNFLEKDSIQKKITLEIYHFDSLNRKIFPARRPLLHQQYNMTYTVVDNAVIVKFQHIRFVIDELDYYIDFNDLINEKENPMIFKDDKQGMISSLTGVAKSLEYYIVNKEIRF